MFDVAANKLGRGRAEVGHSQSSFEFQHADFISGQRSARVTATRANIRLLGKMR
jgi:hypothetical protein